MKKLIWVVIIAAVVIILAAFSLNKTNSNNTGPIKIGIASLLTGDYALLGENIRNTAELAVDEINKAGGINGKMITLFVEDSKVDGKSGLSAISKLINVDKVNYIIAGMSSNGTLASAQLANEKKALLFVPVTGGSDIDNAGEYVFRIANSDNLGGRDIARGMKKLGYKDVAVLSEVTDYTLNFRDSFKKEATNLGLNLILDEQFQPGTTDFRTLILKTKKANPQATLILSQTGLTGAYFIKQEKEQGLKTVLFSDFNLITNADAIKIAGSFDGIYFTDPAYKPNDQALKDFFTNYTNKYGHAPAIPFHTAATYDSIQLLIKAIRAVGNDSVKVHDWLLTNVKSYTGFMGTYSLDEKGNSDLGFALKQVAGDKFIEVK